MALIDPAELPITTRVVVLPKNKTIPKTPDSNESVTLYSQALALLKNTEADPTQEDLVEWATTSNNLSIYPVDTKILVTDAKNRNGVFGVGFKDGDFVLADHKQTSNVNVTSAVTGIEVIDSQVTVLKLSGLDGTDHFTQFDSFPGKHYYLEIDLGTGGTKKQREHVRFVTSGLVDASQEGFKHVVLADKGGVVKVIAPSIYESNTKGVLVEIEPSAKNKVIIVHGDIELSNRGKNTTLIVLQGVKVTQLDNSDIFNNWYEVGPTLKTLGYLSKSHVLGQSKEYFKRQRHLTAGQLHRLIEAARDWLDPNVTKEAFTSTYGELRTHIFENSAQSIDSFLVHHLKYAWFMIDQFNDESRWDFSTVEGATAALSSLDEQYLFGFGKLNHLVADLEGFSSRLSTAELKRSILAISDYLDPHVSAQQFKKRHGIAKENYPEKIIPSWHDHNNPAINVAEFHNRYGLTPDEFFAAPPNIDQGTLSGLLDLAKLSVTKKFAEDHNHDDILGQPLIGLSSPTSSTSAAIGASVQLLDAIWRNQDNLSIGELPKPGKTWDIGAHSAIILKWSPKGEINPEVMKESFLNPVQGTQPDTLSYRHDDGKLQAALAPKGALTAAAQKASLKYESSLKAGTKQLVILFETHTSEASLYLTKVSFRENRSASWLPDKSGQLAGEKIFSLSLEDSE